MVYLSDIFKEMVFKSKLNDLYSIVFIDYYRYF